MTKVNQPLLLSKIRRENAGEVNNNYLEQLETIINQLVEGTKDLTMSIDYVDAIDEQIAATDTTLYTCPANARSSIITAGNCTNEDASAAELTLNIVKSGGSVAVTNEYVPATSLATKTTKNLTELVNLVLKPGDFISVKADVADRLNLKLALKEVYD